MITKVFTTDLYVLYLECISFSIVIMQSLLSYDINISCMKRKSFPLQYKLLLQIFLVIYFHTPKYLSCVVQLNIKSEVSPPTILLEAFALTTTTGYRAFYRETLLSCLDIFQANMDKSRLDLTGKLCNFISWLRHSHCLH